MKYFCILLLLLQSLHSQSITAHRGASYDAPQNSMPAFKLAWEKNADFIEADFYLTADKKVVCFHDRSTGKLADKNLNVEKSTWEDLQKLDVGYKKNKKFKGTRMPLLNEVLADIPEGKGIFIEIKSGATIVPFIKQVISESKVSVNKIHIISFKEDVLKKCKELMPDIKTQWLISIRKNKKTGNPSYSTEALIQKLKAMKADGVGTNFYQEMINKENTLKMQKAGVDFITTDRPQYIREKCKIEK